jgi:hypothetical protein
LIDINAIVECTINSDHVGLDIGLQYNLLGRYAHFGDSMTLSRRMIRVVSLKPPSTLTRPSFFFGLSGVVRRDTAERAFTVI